jgi:8-oxo-dGTP diphosphatase
MVAADGNGWVQCRCGSRHWGRHGAAGLALLRPAVEPGGPGPDGGMELLLQLRAGWTHLGGTWALPGGARDSHEDDVEAALREAAEETGLSPAQARVLGAHPGVDHGDWRYVYVVAAVVGAPDLTGLTPETEALRWVRLGAVSRLPLHHGLRSTWPGLAARLWALAADGISGGTGRGSPGAR